MYRTLPRRLHLLRRLPLLRPLCHPLRDLHQYLPRRLHLIVLHRISHHFRYHPRTTPHSFAPESPCHLLFSSDSSSTSSSLQ